jgi:hypothetical protein
MSFTNNNDELERAIARGIQRQKDKEAPALVMYFVVVNVMAFVMVCFFLGSPIGIINLVLAGLAGFGQHLKSKRMSAAEDAG